MADATAAAVAPLFNCDNGALWGTRPTCADSSARGIIFIRPHKRRLRVLYAFHVSIRSRVHVHGNLVNAPKKRPWRYLHNCRTPAAGRGREWERNCIGCVKQRRAGSGFVAVGSWARSWRRTSAIKAARRCGFQSGAHGVYRAHWLLRIIIMKDTH